MKHEFVECVPDELAPGMLYVCIPFATVVHKCPCGCGSEVVTPLSPTDWKLTFDGKSISLAPSVGNWSLPCQSHYWIEHNQVLWARSWSKREIESGRERARADKAAYYSGSAPADSHMPEVPPGGAPIGLLGRISKWWSGG